METSVGNISYFTGGTAKIPKVVNYSLDRWKESVRITGEVLKAHGVDKDSKVLICHPFAPWAIGQVFAEAAFNCGAHVFPLGLNFMDTNFQSFTLSIGFTHVCATARNMIRWKLLLNDLEERFHTESLQKIFVAGEKLSDKVRVECETLWLTTLVDIYGMAEFDTIAAELPGSESLVLSPHFHYSLRSGNKIIQLSDNALGELLIKRKIEDDWHETGDLVMAKMRWDQQPWLNSFQINFIDRVEENLSLSDGSSIRIWQIKELLKDLEMISRMQIQLSRSRNGDRLQILYMINNEIGFKIEDAIIKTLISSSIDIQDSYRHKTIVAIECNRVENESDFYNTSRGKIPFFYEIAS